MRKQMKLFITLILVLALALSMTACNNTPTPTPTPDPTVTPTVEPTVKPTVEPTVKPTKKPHGGGSIPWPDNPTPVAKTWDGEAALTGSGTYTYIGDKATPVASPDFTGKLIVNDIASLTLVMPKASVEVAGTVGTLVATTGPNTLTFKDGSVVNTVTVNGGNVVVQKDANITISLTVAKTTAAVTETIEVLGAVADVIIDSGIVTPIAIAVKETATVKVTNNTTNAEAKIEVKVTGNPTVDVNGTAVTVDVTNAGADSNVINNNTSTIIGADETVLTTIPEGYAIVGKTSILNIIIGTKKYEIAADDAGRLDSLTAVTAGAIVYLDLGTTKTDLVIDKNITIKQNGSLIKNVTIVTTAMTSDFTLSGLTISGNLDVNSYNDAVNVVVENNTFTMADIDLTNNIQTPVVLNNQDDTQAFNSNFTFSKNTFNAAQDMSAAKLYIIRMNVRADRWYPRAYTSALVSTGKVTVTENNFGTKTSPLGITNLIFNAAGNVDFTKNNICQPEGKKASLQYHEYTDYLGNPTTFNYTKNINDESNELVVNVFEDGTTYNIDTEINRLVIAPKVGSLGSWIDLAEGVNTKNIAISAWGSYITIPAGETFTIKAGQTVTIPTKATLTIEKGGSIVNNGTIKTQISSGATPILDVDYTSNNEFNISVLAPDHEVKVISGTRLFVNFETMGITAIAINGGAAIAIDTNGTGKLELINAVLEAVGMPTTDLATATLKDFYGKSFDMTFTMHGEQIKTKVVFERDITEVIADARHEDGVLIKDSEGKITPQVNDNKFTVDSTFDKITNTVTLNFYINAGADLTIDGINGSTAAAAQGIWLGSRLKFNEDVVITAVSYSKDKTTWENLQVDTAINADDSAHSMMFYRNAMENNGAQTVRYMKDSKGVIYTINTVMHNYTYEDVKFIDGVTSFATKTDYLFNDIYNKYTRLMDGEKVAVDGNHVFIDVARLMQNAGSVSGTITEEQFYFKLGVVDPAITEIKVGSFNYAKAETAHVYPDSMLTINGGEMAKTSIGQAVHVKAETYRINAENELLISLPLLASELMNEGTKEITVKAGETTFVLNLLDTMPNAELEVVGVTKLGDMDEISYDQATKKVTINANIVNHKNPRFGITVKIVGADENLTSNTKLFSKKIDTEGIVSFGISKGSGYSVYTLYSMGWSDDALTEANVGTHSRTVLVNIFGIGSVMFDVDTIIAKDAPVAPTVEPTPVA